MVGEYLHLAGGRARGNSGGNFRTRNHVKRRCSPVEGDASRAGQIGSQNLDRCSYLAGSRLCFHEPVSYTHLTLPTTPYV